MEGITTMDVTNQQDLQTKTDEDNHTIDDLLKLSTQLWIQMLDYEKTVMQISNLDKWLEQHQSKPFLLSIPCHNFRFSVGEGVKSMYDTFRQRKWALLKNTAHRLENHSRQHNGIDLHVNVSALNAESSLALQVDWPSQYWMFVDKEKSRTF